MVARTQDPAGDVWPEDGERDFGTGAVKTLSRKSIINKINLIHFFDREICCHLSSEDGDRVKAVWIKPLPSSGHHLVCLWPESLSRSGELEGLRVKGLSIPEPRESTATLISPDVRRMTGRGVCFRLPDLCETRKRSGVPPLFADVTLRLCQQGIEVAGHVMDMTDERLTVTIAPRFRHAAAGFKPAEHVKIDVEKQGFVVFSGAFTRVEDPIHTERGTLVFAPAYLSVNRFPPRKFRSVRQRLTPAPQVAFTHPVSGRPMHMDVEDLSGSGFSLRTDGGDAMLFPGMVIHGLRLAFNGVFALSCSAQVVHRRNESPGKEHQQTSAIYGFAFIDMPLSHHLKLQNMMHRAENSRISVCADLDTDELWRFFFETGFIYSGKYRPLAESKALVRETYRRIYGRSPDISRHFTYQEKGDVLGHLSMLRFYTNAWLIHHHAALKRSGVKAGLGVLNQLAAFAYNSIWLEACHMRYMFCYFQPDNPFPDYFFNGFAQQLNDRNGCSTDAFSYSIYKNTGNQAKNLPHEWALGPCTAVDLAELQRDYNERGGGLMMDALDLRSTGPLPDDLVKAYRDAGLTRQRHLLALRYGGDLVAVIMLNLADTAINLSDLTCSATFLVLREKVLNRDIFFNVLNLLSGYFPGKRFPVLMYPSDEAEKNNIPVRKTYMLWILSTQYSDPYFEYLNAVNQRFNDKP